jgi:hypothetical protein
MKSRVQNARNLTANIQALEAAMKMSDPPAFATPTFARRSMAMSNAARQPRRAGQVADAGHVHRAARPLKVIAEIPERMAPWIDDGRPVELRVDAYPTRPSTAR